MHLGFEQDMFLSAFEVAGKWYRRSKLVLQERPVPSSVAPTPPGILVTGLSPLGGKEYSGIIAEQSGYPVR